MDFFEKIMVSILFCCLMGAVFSLFMLARNQWVYSVRSKMVDADRDKYMRLPDYETMVWRFWIWDVDKFLK